MGLVTALKNRFILLILITVAFSINGFSVEVNNRYSASLLTYDNGTELYSVFGHSAIRVYDSVTYQDQIYNYGTFNFDTPNFYLKFLQGNLPYRLSRSYAGRVIRNNLRDNRKVIENKLTLTAQETNNLVAFLENNYRPENREYYYDFFYDNCATRILQLIDTVSDRKLNRDYISYKPKSFRDLTSGYLQAKPLAKLGINIGLGLGADKIASPEETCFLPEYLLLSLRANPSILDLNTSTFVPSKKTALHKNYSLIYIFSLLLLVVLLIAIIEYRKNTHFRIVDILIYWPAILVGIFLILFWLFSGLTIIENNLNILWANPLLLALLIDKKYTKFWRVLLITCLSAALIYSIFYLKEWPITIYIVLLFTRVIKSKALQKDN